MKKLLIILLVTIAIVSCKEEAPKDYVSLQGKISNLDVENLLIVGRNFKKEIKVNKDGTFQDTLKVTNGFHGFQNGPNKSSLYLKNGDDLTLNFDASNFTESIEFDGDGAGTNQYITEKIAFFADENLMNPKELFSLPKEEFDNKMSNIEITVVEMLENATDLDPEVVKLEKESNAKIVEFFTMNYEKENFNLESSKKGAPSPKFNYPDTKGNNVSLDDFKGKYVYVDVWATWCGPCKTEIPFLKKLDEEYKDKDLAIVSLSIDKQEHKDKWLKMVADENLQGIQIMADKEWNSDFVRGYNITAIPRFILIDKEGNIVNANAPRPSSPNLKELFNSLGI